MAGDMVQVAEYLSSKPNTTKPNQTNKQKPQNKTPKNLNLKDKSWSSWVFHLGPTLYWEEGCPPTDADRV
jgi:hypothetical protein